MSVVLTYAEPRHIGYREQVDEPLGPHDVRIRTLYSGISAGTELTAYRGSNPYLHKQWDVARRLFVPNVATSLQYPVDAFGYEECGVVVEIGVEVTRVRVDDMVYGTWGHRSEVKVTEEYAAQRLMPKGLDPILGVFSQIGAIGLNGVHDAAIRIGETVAIFGLGTPGQIIAQLAKRSGAYVAGVDLFASRRNKAIELHAVDKVIDGRDPDVAEQIKAWSDGRGADVCIEASGAYPALQEAIRTAAYSAKVVTLGFFQGGGQALVLGEEFHHNRINVVCSQIFGVSPELTYRWNQTRLAAAVMQLQAENALVLKPIITRVLPFSQAAEAYRLCDEEPENEIQVVLDFAS